MEYLTYSKIMQMVKKLILYHNFINFIILKHNNLLFIILFSYQNHYTIIMI